MGRIPSVVRDLGALGSAAVVVVVIAAGAAVGRRLLDPPPPQSLGVVSVFVVIFLSLILALGGLLRDLSIMSEFGC